MSLTVSLLLFLIVRLLNYNIIVYDFSNNNKQVKINYYVILLC